jgi:uncharacterized lipoprotein
MKTIITLLAIIGLSGCSSLPYCGTPEAEGQRYCSESLGSTVANFNATYPNAFSSAPRPAAVLPAAPSQATGKPKPDSYQTILVNTPNGLVQKRCKMLNGKAVYCI